jgi:hypothetical protein
MACEVADLPNAAALNDFVNTAVPDQRHLEADAIRNTAPLGAPSVAAARDDMAVIADIQRVLASDAA